MTSLIEKFRNTRFPNWMRQIKTSEPEETFQAANDNNISFDIDSMASAAGKFNLSEELYRAYRESLLYDRATINLKHTQQYAGLMNNTARDIIPADIIPAIKFKLKMPVRLKRRLRRDKKNYQKVREWIDELEKSVNQALLGSNTDER